MTKPKTLQWGDDIGLSELAHLLRTGISFLAVVRENLTMVGSLERFYVKRLHTSLLALKMEGEVMTQGMWMFSKSWKTQEDRFF